MRSRDSGTGSRDSGTESHDGCDYAGGMHRSCLQEQLVWTLRNWPLELIEWETTNSHRLDIRFNPEQDRCVSGRGLQVEAWPGPQIGQ